MNRKRLLNLSIGALLATIALGAPEASARESASDKIAALEHHIGGRIGFVAFDVGSGRKIEHRAHERFATCSTFKWMLAAAVLERAVQPEAPFSLETRRSFTERDLLEYAPVTRAHVREGKLAVSALVDAVLEVSDNTAANLLLPLVGGPAGLTQWLRSHGDATTRLDRDEPTLNTNIAGDPRDTTTPDAETGILKALLLDRGLPTPARERLIAAMVRSSTGAARLRAGIPSGWRVADKTGTGQRGAVNDVAVAWPTTGSPIVLAAFLSDSTQPLAALEAVHAELARIAIAAFTQ